MAGHIDALRWGSAPAHLVGVSNLGLSRGGVGLPVRM